MQTGCILVVVQAEHESRSGDPRRPRSRVQLAAPRRGHRVQLRGGQRERGPRRGRRVAALHGVALVGPRFGCLCSPPDDATPPLSRTQRHARSTYRRRTRHITAERKTDIASGTPTLRGVFQDTDKHRAICSVQSLTAASLGPLPDAGRRGGGRSHRHDPPERRQSSGSPRVSLLQWENGIALWAHPNAIKTSLVGEGTQQAVGFVLSEEAI